MERSSFVRNLNLDDTVLREDSPNQSFGISGVTLENSFGFKMELENFQTAKSHLEVSVWGKGDSVGCWLLDWSRFVRLETGLLMQCNAYLASISNIASCFLSSHNSSSTT